MNLANFNALPTAEIAKLLENCCGAGAWVAQMTQARPFNNFHMLQQTAEQIWWALEEAAWREAFTHHPKIGDINSLRTKFASTWKWAANEQAGVQQADEVILHRLADGNQRYEQRFGYIFIVCATGKSAGEMLAILEARLNHDPPHEIRIAAEEQCKIMHIRLKKLLDSAT